jgi:ferredoxin-NADP reductase/ferredoxin
MTSFKLLLWIAAGFVLQLAIYLGINFWRHWQGYQALRKRDAELNLPATIASAKTLAEPASASWSGYRSFRLAGKVVEDKVKSTCSYYLAPEDGQALPPFLPGQYLTFQLALPSATVGTEEIIRCYSLSDAPRPDAYRVSIKRVLPPKGSKAAPGRSSSYFHDQVEVGALLRVRAPAGHFHIDRGDAPVVLIGGGIGITPMLSMIIWLAREQPSREVWLFYGVRNSSELIMQPDLDALAASNPNFHLQLCFSDPMPEDRRGRDYMHRGRIDVSLLRMQLPLKPYHFYICGPTSMLESLVPALEDWGIPAARIHFEAFGPASIKRRSAPDRVDLAFQGDAKDAGIVVTFVGAGKQLPWQPAKGNLLDFAEANGISVSSGCRAGACGSCQTTIQSGEVTYRQIPEYDPKPGTCLLCVSVPKTSVALEV